MSVRCEHSGYHSGIGRYAPDEGRLRFVLVCDDCGALMREVAAVDYAPAYAPSSAGALPARKAFAATMESG